MKEIIKRIKPTSYNSLLGWLKWGICFFTLPLMLLAFIDYHIGIIHYNYPLDWHDDGTVKKFFALSIPRLSLVWCLTWFAMVIRYRKHIAEWEDFKIIKRALWFAISILTALMAAMITILVIGLCWMQFALFFSVGLAAIILYFLIPKRWGIFGISMSIIILGLYILFIMVSGIFYQPLNCLMSSCLSICAVYAILKDRERWQRLAVMGIFVLVGAFCLFHNDIIGPMEFMIRDRPIDMPSQWLHCYRFFWAGIFIKTSTFSSSILSILFLFVVSIFKKHMNILKTFYDSVKLGL